MLRSVLLILTGNAAASLLTLARNLIVARLITVENYGIAATFAVVVSVAEMMSNLGLQQQIIQSKEGDDARFQANLQGFSVLRGMISGGALFLLAAPMAGFLNIGNVAWTFQVMALVPILNSCVHYDIHRLNRSMQFLPLMVTGTVPALGAVLLLWPLSVWFGDYRIMLYSILAQSLLMVIVSHIVAERPYKLLLDRILMARSLSFGWPLLVNGILLFLVLQGDKALVGRELGMASLAIFAMGFTFTLTPTLIMDKSAQSFFLPQLSAILHQWPTDHLAFERLARAVIQVGLLSGVFLVLAMLLLGDLVVNTLLGAKYEALRPILVWLAIMQAFRVFKSGSGIVALSMRKTSNAMIANFVRIATLPVAWWILVSGSDLKAVIWVSTMGELAGFFVSFLLVIGRLGLDLRPAFLSIAIALSVMGLAATSQILEDTIPAFSFAGLLSIAVVLLVWSMRDLRRYLRRRVEV